VLWLLDESLDERELLLDVRERLLDERELLLDEGVGLLGELAGREPHELGGCVESRCSDSERSVSLVTTGCAAEPTVQKDDE